MKHCLFVRIALFLAFCLSASSPSSAAEPKDRSSTIVVLGDTQCYYAYYGEHPWFPDYPRVDVFGAQTKWIQENLQKENIAFVTHVGDVTYDGPKSHWEYADRCFKMLEDKVPYSVTCGNHDPGIQSYFGTARYQGKPWYLGGTPDQLAHAQLFDACGVTCLHINLPYGIKPAQLDWAKGIMDAHRGKPTVITTHEFLAYKRLGRASYIDSAQHLWKTLIEPYPEVFLVFCGHDWPSRNETTTTPDGRRVLQVMCNYQDLIEGGSGFLQKVVLDAARGEIRVKTYSPRAFKLS